MSESRFTSKEGQRVPRVSFPCREGDAWVTKTTDELFSGKNVVVFSLPGAFTPTCSSTHLPRYNELAGCFQAEGIDRIACISVNDAFVMNAWGKSQGVKNVKLIPDGSGAFTRKMGMLVAKDNLGFGMRSWRYAAVINDGVIEHWFEEEGLTDNCETDPYGVSSPENILEALKNARTAEAA